MRLLRLRLQNFRQHADTEVRFGDGLTGIVGPNGAGKSTLLEAFAWALYGSGAARGTNDTLRFSRAAPRSRVEVEAEFALGGQEYRVCRTPGSAAVFLDGSPEAVAATTGSVNTYLQDRLGMSREEFFYTYFTGQKQLHFLGGLGPADRARFLSQVLGYERLKLAQDAARARRAELRTEIRTLREALGDPHELSAVREAAEARAATAREELRTAESALTVHSAALERLAPAWEQIQAARERDRELGQAGAVAERDAAAAQEAAATATAELERIASAEEQLRPLRLELAQLAPLAADCERFAALARSEERRRALTEELEVLEGELAKAAGRVAQLEAAPDLIVRYAAELAELRAERERVQSERDAASTAWQRDLEKAETNLKQLQDRGRELKEERRRLQELGDEGTCPTCGQPVVGDAFIRLLSELTEQWTTVVQDGKWWRSRVEQLKPQPAEVIALERRLTDLGSSIDECAVRHTRCEAAVGELAVLREERAGRAARQAALRATLETLPSAYDPEPHQRAEARLAELRAIQTRAARLEESVARGAQWRQELRAAEERRDAARERTREAERARGTLGFAEQRYDQLRQEHVAAVEQARAAELRSVELRGILGAEQAALETARRAEAEHAERTRDISQRELDLRYHDELDTALGRLRGQLNDALRPELAEVASHFLAELTDGRYAALRIDDSYNVLVLDEGEEKPVLSGGEEDVVNLVLRISLSQMIAERVGHPLTLLVLDEVFGSLDLARRDNVVRLLHRLSDRFEQVILITHVETIRESLDRVLRVEFDERSGASIVREDTPRPTPELVLSG